VVHGARLGNDQLCSSAYGALQICLCSARIVKKDLGGLDSIRGAVGAEFERRRRERIEAPKAPRGEDFDLKIVSFCAINYCFRKLSIAL